MILEGDGFRIIFLIVDSLCADFSQQDCARELYLNLYHPSRHDVFLLCLRRAAGRGRQPPYQWGVQQLWRHVERCASARHVPLLLHPRLLVAQNPYHVHSMWSAIQELLLSFAKKS